jgi:hypothetical protein
MKKNILSIFAGLFVVSALLFTACGDDNKCTTECGTHGTVNAAPDCSCNCEAGYKLDAGNGRCDVKIAGYEMFGDYTATSVKCITPPSTVAIDGASYTTSVSDQTVANAAGEKVRLKNLGDYGCTVNNVPQDYYVEGTMKGDSVIINSTACNTAFVGKGFFKRDATSKKVTNFTVVYSATYDLKVGAVTTKTTDKCTEIFAKK